MIKLKIYRPIFRGDGRPIWLEGKHWRLAFPTRRFTYFHFQKFDKNGKNGERMCYNIGIMKKAWGWKWSLDNITFFVKFPSDNDSPQCG